MMVTMETGIRSIVLSGMPNLLMICPFPVKAINFVGGGAKSDIWCQIHADVLDRPLRKVNQPIQANLRGAAFLASVALGHMTFDDIADHTQIDRVFEPNSANRQIYDLLFEEFLNIYRQNKGIYRRLNLELV